MSSLDETRSFFKGDRFVANQGIVIDSISEDGAVCSVVLTGEHKNALGSAQGGLIFTLADFAFAVAANSATPGTVTLNSTINYIRAPKDGVLTATAVCRNKSRSICVYEVTVTDQSGACVAMVTTTGYIKST